MNGAAIFLAVQLARTEAESALPNAPVIAGRQRPVRTPVRTARVATARALRLTADRLSPAAHPACG
jgi:hypothetical protein